VKIGIAAGAMGVVCWLVVKESHALLAGSSARIADIAIGIPAGAASFYAVASALRIPELAGATQSALRRFRGGT
jgi:hypothetical protein